MHVVTLIEPINTQRWKLAAGSWLMDNLNAAELMLDADRGAAFLQFYDTPRGWTVNLDGGKSRLLWIHNGGFGDLLMAVPALREYAHAHPENEITISCRQRVHCVLDHLPFVPKLIDYPPPLSVVERFNLVVTSENMQEAGEDYKTAPAIDIKAKLLEVGPLTGEQRKTEYLVTESEWAFAVENFPKKGIPRIGVQLAASSPTRTYHPRRCGEVIEKLYTKGYEIFLFGSPGSIPDDVVPPQIQDRVINLTAHNLTFRQSAAVAQTCDCLFVPDSALCHVAGALGIPCVAIFSATHWRQRTADYKSVHAIQEPSGCKLSPCYHHPHGNNLWPKDGPCNKDKFCTSLQNITPERIVTAIEKQMKTPHEISRLPIPA